MLQLKDFNKKKIALLYKCKDLYIESVLSTCDRTLSFSYPYEEAKQIKEEMYVSTQTDEFVIKEIEEGDAYTNFKAVLNVENIIGKDWDRFTNVQPETVEATILLALAGTGWSVKINGSITKKRLVKKNMCSSWDILQEIKKIFRVEYNFDTINKVVNVYEKLGNDKGVYFMEGLNLKKIDIQRHSHNYATKLIAYGKGDLKVEVTNTTYSSKPLTAIWKDERYTVLTDLQEDAQAKLDDLAIPYKSYKANVIDLANISGVDVLSYSIGDTIRLISKDYDIKEKQRIIKITEYPNNPEKNTVELANLVLTFENKQKEFQDATDTVENITEDNYTVSENAIKASVHNIIVATIDVDELNAISGRFGALEASVAHIQDLSAVNAVIKDLTALKEDVKDLSAVNAKITNLEGKTAQFDTTLSKFLSSGSTQTLHLTSSNVVIDNAVIKSAMIDSISANKLTSGFINTNNVQIKSANGHMLMDGTTIKISDVNRTRVQIGEDAQHDYNIYIWDRQGNLMFDGVNGLRSDGVKSGIIRNDMISDTANISASKLDISTLFNVINNDGTHTLNSSKIHLDDKNQTLDVAFNSLTSKVDNFQIGGTNLIRGSKDFIINSDTGWRDYSGGRAKFYYDTDGFKVLHLESSGNTNDIWASFASHDYHIKKGDTVTVSFEFKTENLAALDPHFILAINGYDTAGSRVEYFDHYPLAIVQENNKWYKLSYTATYTKDVTHGNIQFHIARNGSFHIKKPKSEFGNKATDWSPAPEDVDTAINSIKIGGRNYALKSNEHVSSTDYNIHSYKLSDIKIGDNELVTIQIKGTLPDSKTEWGIWNTDWNTDIGFIKKSDGVNGVYTGHFYWKVGSTANTNLLLFSRPDNGEKVPTTVEWIKIEKGNKATDWTPAPEDIEEVTTNIQTSLHVEQGRIDELIKNTTITKVGGQVVQLKDEYNQTVATVNSINSTIAIHTTKIDALTNQITGVETKANTLERDLEGTKSTVSASSTKIEEVNSKVDNIQIGGRNIIPNSYINTTSTKYGFEFRDFKLEANTEYAFTINGRVNGNISGKKAVVFIYENSWNILIKSLGIDSSKDTSVSLTFKTPPDYPPDTEMHLACYYYPGGSENDGGSATINWVKLEKGNKPTDWTAAPEDTQAKITEAHDLATSADTKAGTAQTTAETAKTDATNAHNLATTADAKAVEAHNLATSADNKINNLSIGGNNLYLDTKSYSNGEIWTFGTAPVEHDTLNGFGVVRIKGSWGKRWQSVPVESDTIYTMSAWVKRGDQETAPTLIGVYTTDGNNSPNDATVLNKAGFETDVPPPLNKWIRISVTFRTSTTSTKCFTRFEPYVTDFNTKNPDMSFYGLKLEKGNIATDWSPSPLDAESEIKTIHTSMSTIDQKVDHITATVTDTTTQITALGTRVTSAESSITQLSTSITNKVGHDDVISIIKQTSDAVEYAFNNISPTVSISATGLNINNKVGSKVFGVDANTGNVEMNIFDSHFKMSATGARSTEMWCDVHDLFHVRVPFTQNGGGIRIYTDTDVTLFEAIKTTENGQEVHLPTYTKIKSLTTEDFSNVGDMSTCHGYLKIFSDGDKKTHMKFNADDSGSGFILETSRNKPIFEYTHHMDGSDESMHCHMWLKTSDISTTGTIAITGDIWCSGRATGNAFTSLSNIKYKKDLEDINIDLLTNIILENDIKHYKMIDDEHSDTRTGLILDDLTESARNLLNLTDSEGIDIYSMSSILWSVVQNQQKRIVYLESII